MSSAQKRATGRFYFLLDDRPVSAKQEGPPDGATWQTSEYGIATEPAPKSKTRSHALESHRQELEQDELQAQLGRASTLLETTRLRAKLERMRQEIAAASSAAGPDVAGAAALRRELGAKREEQELQAAIELSLREGER